VTITVPTSPDELTDFLAEKKNREAVMSDPKKMGEFITNYANNVHKADASIEQQAEEQAQRVLRNLLKENGVELNRPDLTPKNTPTWTANSAVYKGQVRNPNAMGAAIDNEFSNMGDYLKTIDHRTIRNNYHDVAEKLSTLRNAMSSTVPSEGGFLVPEVMRAELLRVALEQAIVRPRARVIPMEALRVAFPALDSTSNASSVFGGIVAYWTEEAAALVQSSPTFSKIVLEARKLTAYTEVPNELIDDSMISFNAFISETFPQALAWYEDLAFLSGSGVGEPLGVLNAGNNALIAVSKETGQNADTIVWENILKAYSRMLPSSIGRAVWVAHIDTFPELSTMALSVGTGGGAVWTNGGEAAPFLTLLGRPVIFTEKANTVGDQGDISFVDFGHYLIGDRQAMTAMSSPHYKFGNDVTAFRFISRVDGRPWLQSAITPKNGSNTLSPFVQIAARA
jgi:HK97 family phage major capsid protein